MEGVNEQAVVFYARCPSSMHSFHHLVFSALVHAGRVSTVEPFLRRLGTVSLKYQASYKAL
jgi:hypothetical protein